MSYESMSEEDMILQAFDFVARGVPIPNRIAQFLKDEGLYDAINNPVELADVSNEIGVDARHIGVVSGKAGTGVPATGSNMATR